MAKARVTAEERRLANLQAKEAAKYERQAVAAAARTGFRALRAAINAYKAGNVHSVASSAGKEIIKGADELGNAMAVAYMQGVLRTRRAAKALSLSSTASAAKVFEQQLKLTPKQASLIRKYFHANAMAMLETTRRSINRKVQATMARVIGEGMHVKDGVKALTSTFKAAGIEPSNSFYFENVYRTNMQTAYNAAKWQSAHEDPLISEYLWGYKYVTVGDDRVRPEHEGMDGVTLPKDDPFWVRNFPPNGFACRCQVIEIFGEREAVPPPDTYTTTDDSGRTVSVIPGADKGFESNPGLVQAAVLDFIGTK